MLDRIVAASVPPPTASNASVAPVSASASVSSLTKEDAGLLRVADDVHERDPIGETDPVEHLAEVRCGGGMDQRGVALAAHGLDHA
jgi:hypothetical protein